jgi:serine/threonine-protein kinase
MLAKAIDGELAVEITQPGQLIGEIEYLAPERTMAESVIDIRSDIYGLGATCFALLTGHPPAQGKNLTELLQNIRHGQPKAPRTYQLAINELFQDLIVVRMLSKNPADRVQTPIALIEELDRIGRYNNLK